MVMNEGRLLCNIDSRVLVFSGFNCISKNLLASLPLYVYQVYQLRKFSSGISRLAYGYCILEFLLLFNIVVKLHYPVTSENG